jgi:hypothetical protein
VQKTNKCHAISKLEAEAFEYFMLMMTGLKGSSDLNHANFGVVI